MVEMVLNNLVLAFWRLYRHKKLQTRSLSESSRDTPHHYATIRQVSVCLAKWTNGETSKGKFCLQREVQAICLKFELLSTWMRIYVSILSKSRFVLHNTDLKTELTITKQM